MRGLEEIIRVNASSVSEAEAQIAENVRRNAEAASVKTEEVPVRKAA
jgi:hypothetical protein